MASTEVTGKHRRSHPVPHGGVGVAGVVTLAASGVVAAVAAPALASPGDSARPADAGPRQAVTVPDGLAEQIDAQARVQQVQAQRAAAKAAQEQARREAARQAHERREAKERAAREAERRRLNAFVAPIQGSYVSTPYHAVSGLWSSGAHTGVDFHAAPGTVVRAVGAGTVVEAGWDGAYGQSVVIRMNDGTYTQYGHLSSIAVHVGQHVTPGLHIGLSGRTGHTTGPHLHFEARTTPDYGSDIDPVAYLRAHGVSL
ncbi:M23 family metallopeptidase [Streptomyces sp. B1866]|uniref:M23 family metallopeptidase n=1 Tax=Streptomyces sp. B1866 TaxID=3075431 RepID=UPI002891BD8D|nr:M23 family metallopeptidase [Streptomyces sp. B1866]MDT3397686.1 M23 family metallopeptidase [Streptomyces sp. B1866]